MPVTLISLVYIYSKGKEKQMIHEIRTYNLKPRSIELFGENTKAKLTKRLEYSALGGFWYTEMGPLNQVVHIWPYDDLNERAKIRRRATADGVWPPDNDNLIMDMRSDIMIPAPFMKPMGPSCIGPIYEMRIYTYRPRDIPLVLQAWSDCIEDRESYSALGGCWYSDVGELNKFVHLWGYKSLEERAKIRAEVIESGVWPPRSEAVPLKQENKILVPFDFSPMQ